MRLRQIPARSVVCSLRDADSANWPFDTAVRREAAGPGWVRPNITRHASKWQTQRVGPRVTTWSANLPGSTVGWSHAYPRQA